MAKAAVFIGRFQPFHKAHSEILKAALSKYDRVVVVLGSHNSLRSLKNPWTAEERQHMIEKTLPDFNIRNKLRFHYQEDRPGQDQQWFTEVRQAVNTALFEQKYEVSLVGCNKDNSSYYLKYFPEWQQDLSKVLYDGVSSTKIRNDFFAGEPDSTWALQLHPAVAGTLKHFKETNFYRELTKPHGA